MSSTRIRGVQILDGTLTNAKVADGAAIADEKLLNGLEFLLRDGSRPLTGNLNLGGHQILNVQPGEDPTDAVNLAQVEAHMANFDFQADVLGVQEDATLDPVVATGSRYIITVPGTVHTNFDGSGSLVAAGVTANDVIEYNGSAWEVVYDVETRGEGALLWDQASNTFQQWTGTLWQPTGSLNGVTAGAGLTKTAETISAELGSGLVFNGNAITLDPDGVTLELSADKLQVVDAGITAVKLNADVAGAGLASTLGVLSVNASAGLEVSGDAVGIADLGVITSKFALNSVTKDIIADDVAGLGISQAGGGELDVNVDSSSLEIDMDIIRVKADGITEAMLNASVAGEGLEKNVGTGKIDIKYDSEVFKIENDELGLRLADESLEIVSGGLRLKPIGDGYTYVGGDNGLPIPVKQEYNENLELNTANTTADPIREFNSSRTDFLLDLEILSGTEEVFVNGLKLTPTDDYAITTTNNVSTITFTGDNTPVAGDIILISYQGFEPA